MTTKTILSSTNLPASLSIPAEAFITTPYHPFSKSKKDTRTCLSCIDWTVWLQDSSFMESQNKSLKSSTNKIKVNKWKKCTTPESLVISPGNKRFSAQKFSAFPIKMEFIELQENFSQSNNNSKTKRIKTRAKISMVYRLEIKKRLKRVRKRQSRERIQT